MTHGVPGPRRALRWRRGAQVAYFWATLVLLGVGWSFWVFGASTLVLECHQPHEKTRVQSLNDFIVFGVMAVGSFSSGGLLAVYGCSAVLWVSFLPLALAALVLVAVIARRNGRGIRGEA